MFLDIYVGGLESLEFLRWWETDLVHQPVWARIRTAPFFKNNTGARHSCKNDIV